MLPIAVLRGRHTDAGAWGLHAGRVLTAFLTEGAPVLHFWGVPQPPEARRMHAQALYAAAFLTTALSGLAALVHLLALQLFGHDPHLPPCAPDQRVCAETYNLLLVL